MQNERWPALALGSCLVLLSGCHGGGSSPAPAPGPSITTFAASPASITAGASTRLTGTFAYGSGVITPGELPATSGVGVSVSPVVTTTYLLTVSNPAGQSASKSVLVTVVPAASSGTAADRVQASGAQQVSAGGTFTNAVVVGEPVPAVASRSSSQAVEVRHDFTPPVPGH